MPEIQVQLSLGQSTTVAFKFIVFEMCLVPGSKKAVVCARHLAIGEILLDGGRPDEAVTDLSKRTPF